MALVTVGVSLAFVLLSNVHLFQVTAGHQIQLLQPRSIIWRHTGDSAILNFRRDCLQLTVKYKHYTAVL